jgi:hypothetical protein
MRFFTARATPVSVPPVPAVITTASSLLSVWSQISTPVPSSCAGVRRVAVLVEDVRVRDHLAQARATPMWLSGASHAASVGVRMISAPSASSTTCFSRAHLLAAS